MSKQLSVRMYLKRQKKDAEGKVPIYVHVTIDGAKMTFPFPIKSFQMSGIKRNKNVLASPRNRY